MIHGPYGLTTRPLRSIEEIDAHRVDRTRVQIDGQIRELYQSEFLVQRQAEGRAAVERMRSAGCCGCRKWNGECGNVHAAAELIATRKELGMGRRTRGLIADLCPQSEMWLVYEITHDAEAVAAAKNRGANE